MIHKYLGISLKWFPSALYQLGTRGEATITRVLDYPFHGRDAAPNITTGKKMPSITTIIDKTMPIDRRVVLKRWRESMIEKLGREEFLKNMARNKSIGKDFHIMVTDYLSKTEEPIILDGIRPYFRSAEAFLNEIQQSVAIEKDVYHSALNYKGRLDGIVKVNETVCVLEWKTVHTGRRVTSLYQAYDSPMQMAAYAGALNQMCDGPKISNGLLVYVYNDGAPADVLPMTEEELLVFWERWLRRLENYLTLTPDEAG